MKIRTYLSRISVPIIFLALSSCATKSPPASVRNTAWNRFTNGQGHENILFVQISPVGPPRWRYLVESLQPTPVTNSPPPGWSSPGWFPAWRPAGIALTNVAINVTGCRVVEVSPNWQVRSGSSFVFEQTQSGTSDLRFTLEGIRTNGPIELRVSDVAGANTFVGGLSGPQ